MGSKLYAKLDKKTKVNWWCTKKHDWYLIWADPVKNSLFPPEADCWTDNVELKYNGTYNNTEGVEIRPNSDGKLESIIDFYKETWN